MGAAEALTSVLRKTAAFIAAALSLASLAGCNAHQSALSPFGEEAASVRTLTLVMLIAAVIIAIGMTLLMRHAIRAPEGELTHKRGMRLVLWLGGIVPTLLLFVLLVSSLPVMRPMPVSPADLNVRVQGEQFWWRMVYRPPGGTAVESANELRLPVGRTVELKLEGGDVIHSFWIPGLAGKMDMIPGRTNTLVVRATKAGRFRGVCTEFCGLSHALMAFEVVAMEPAAFDAWLVAERRPADASTTAPGARLFAQYGCSGCHAIRGGPEPDRPGVIGPDLTHFGGRATMAAAILPNTTGNVARFIRHPERIKPGVRMPAFPHMPEGDAVAIARYLQGLR